MSPVRQTRGSVLAPFAWQLTGGRTAEQERNNKMWCVCSCGVTFLDVWADIKRFCPHLVQISGQTLFVFLLFSWSVTLCSTYLSLLSYSASFSSSLHCLPLFLWLISVCQLRSLFVFFLLLHFCIPSARLHEPMRFDEAVEPIKRSCRNRS